MLIPDETLLVLSLATRYRYQVVLLLVLTLFGGERDGKGVTLSRGTTYDNNIRPKAKSKVNRK